MSSVPEGLRVTGRKVIRPQPVLGYRLTGSVRFPRSGSPGRLGENGRQTIEPAKRLVRLFEQALEGLQAHRRIRREWRRHERSDALFAVSFDNVAAQSLALFLVGRHKILSLDPFLRKDTLFSFR